MAFINGLNSSFPTNKYSQREIISFSKSIFPKKSDFFKMLKVYENSGVKNRYLVSKLDWYRKNHGWKETNYLFKKNAISLLKSSIRKTFKKTKTNPQKVGAIIIVNTTGILTPTLDAEIFNLFNFKNEIKRLPIFGFGCAGGILGINRGIEIYNSIKQPVLVCNVELCSLTFRPHVFSKENIVSTALFGDAASSYLIDNQGDCKVESTMDFTWKKSLGLMGWKIEDDGLGVVFDKIIPNFILDNLPKVIQSFYQKKKTGLILHPGGRKIIDAYKKIFENNKSIQISEQILSEYGNVSSVSVLLVLERAIKNKLFGDYVMAALGPGFTVGLSKIVIQNANR